MSKEIINTAILAAAFLVVFGTAEFMYHFLKMAVEITRKFVHIASGFIALLFPLLINNQWYVLFLCASFALILICSIRFDLLPSINAVNRKTLGSIAYPAAVYGCYVVYAHVSGERIYFYLPILILSICDPLAAAIGKRFGTRKYQAGADQKSYAGSIAFFLSAFVISLVLLSYFTTLNGGRILIYSLIAGICSAIAEGLSRRGLDNITIPATILFLMKFIFLI